MMLSKVYIIIPVHNRKDITLKCLETLKNLGCFDKYHIIVIDDGSTDGTKSAINHLYPQVIVLLGDGNLYWTGAIKLGMEYAYNHNADYFIWLNDDTFPQPKIIDSLIKICQSHPQKLVSAQCYTNLDFTTPSYGAHIKVGYNFISAYTTQNKVINADCVSGNLVCLPRSIVEDIGYPEADKFPHFTGDFIYTWKAKQFGYIIECYSNLKAVCVPNQQEDWLLGNKSIWQNFRSVFTPKSYYHFSSYWHYCIRIYGILGILMFVRPYYQLLRAGMLRLLFSRQFLIELKKYKSILFNQ